MVKPVIPLCCLAIAPISKDAMAPTLLPTTPVQNVELVLANVRLAPFPLTIPKATIKSSVSAACVVFPFVLPMQEGLASV